MGDMLPPPYTKLIVSDLTLNISIGVLEEEKRNTQNVIINIEAGLPPGILPKKDSIKEVLSYTDLVDTAQAIAEEKHFHLVETLAEKIANMCLQKFKLAYITVRVEKPDILENAIVGVEICRSRE